MQAQMLNDSTNDLVVLLFRCTEIRPREILQLSDDATVNNLSIGVFSGQLEPSLDQVRHEGFHRNEKYFLIAVKGDTLYRFVFPNLTRPVLMTLDLRMLLQMRQHDNQRDAFLVNHSPKILNR